MVSKVLYQRQKPGIVSSGITSKVARWPEKWASCSLHYISGQQYAYYLFFKRARLDLKRNYEFVCPPPPPALPLHHFIQSVHVTECWGWWVVRVSSGVWSQLLAQYYSWCQMNDSHEQPWFQGILRQKRWFGSHEQPWFLGILRQKLLFDGDIMIPQWTGRHGSYCETKMSAHQISNIVRSGYTDTLMVLMHISWMKLFNLHITKKARNVLKYNIFLIMLQLPYKN